MIDETKTIETEIATEPENVLSDNQLSDIVEIAKAEREANVDKDMERIAAEVVVNPDAELEGEQLEVPIGTENVNDMILAGSNKDTAPSISIFDAGDPEKVDEAIKDLTISNAKDNFNLTDEEAMDVMEIIANFKKPGYRVYDKLPASMKFIVDAMMRENRIPVNKREPVARIVVEQMINDAGVEEAFVDFEKSMDEALNMTSIMDMYSAHTQETFEVRVPELISKIKDIDPEKAEALQKIKDAFDDGYSFKRAYEAYEGSNFVRKAVRRYQLEYKRSLSAINFGNQRSTFRFNDATEMPIALAKVLIEEAHSAANPESELKARLRNLAVTDVDIQKFCILISKTCTSLNTSEVVDAAYVYYMIRNIISLKLTHEAKTEFAIKLINNICDVITFIRDKEAYLNAANLDQSKPTTKLHSDKSGKNKR